MKKYPLNMRPIGHVWLTRLENGTDYTYFCYVKEIGTFKFYVNVRHNNYY